MRALRPAPLNPRLAGVLRTWALVSTGGWVFTVALAVYTYSRSGATGVGLVTAARLLPAMLGAPFTGRLVDRGDRARLVVLSCVVQTILIGTTAALASADASLAIIVPIAALNSIAMTTPRPALGALMPALAASPDELTRATGIWSAVDNGAFLVGAGLGGVLIAAVGTGAVIAGSAGLYALGGVVATRLPSVMATPADEEDSEETGLASAFAGLKTLAHARALQVPYALFTALMLLEGTTDVQLVALALGHFDVGKAGPGLLFAAWGVGGLLGSGLIVYLVRRRGYGLALAVGTFAFAIGLAVSGLDGLPLALAAMIPVGIGFALGETAVMGLVPRLADDAAIGRVYALSEIVYAGAGGVGALIAPELIHAVGAAGSLAVAGLAFGVCGLLGWASYGRLDAGQEQAGRVRELLRGIRFLASLPLPQVERLVRGARALNLPAGADIIRLGDPGEEFFVIEEGVVDIVEYGRQEGAGEGFGEIALLRDVPRTATVRASTAVKLWAISRPAFIAAVLRHGDAHHLADAVVAEHLARPRTVVGSD